MQQCLVLVKTGLTVVQKCSSSIMEKIEKNCEVTISSLEALLRLLATILKTDMFLADCRSAAGLMFALICKTWCPLGPVLVNMVTSMFHHPNTPAIEPSHLQQLILSFDLYKSVPDLSRLYLCHGFLVMLEPRDLVQDLGQGDTALLDVLFPEIYQLTECLANSSNSLAAARTLCQWVEVTGKLVNKVESSHVKSALSGPSPIPQKLLLYVTTHWDHPVDGIRHQTKAIFEGVMKIHVKTVNGVSVHQDPFILDTLSTLLSTDWHTRGKYGPLGCIFEMEGASNVINLYPGVLKQLLAVMGEHAMATHSCEVIEKLFNQHKRELQHTEGNSSLLWNETWVVPILAVLSDQTKPSKQKGFIIDYLIPKLLKCSPPSLAFIIQHLSSQEPFNAPRMKEGNPSQTQPLTADAVRSKECFHGNHESSSSSCDGGKLGALLSCLKTARSLGLLKSGQDADTTKKEKRQERVEESRKVEEEKKEEGLDSRGKEDEEARLWKGLVPVRLLCQALSHSTDQIRIDTIGLLCDSNKTTEDVSEIDLSLLIFSLPLNLNNPSPSFRQQLISHIKKLLFRLRESGRILFKKSQRAQDLQDYHSRLLLKYKDFLDWLCSVMFHSLRPGFGYACRATSLQALTAIHATFTSSINGLFATSTLWSTSRVNLMVTRLMDNYESNRVMAFDLLASLPQAILGLESPKKLQDRYRVAYDLAISNKPYNCETAAYVFRLLIRQVQPSLYTGLSTTTNVEAMEYQSQSRLDARSSIESNTLWVMQELCNALEEQVEVARESLLETAVQGPMYGVLHCLRILLGDTDLKTLPKVAAWKCVVTRLIQLCFDVADVAATVVCNSTPEGFIPSEQKQEKEEEGECGARSKLETLHVTPQMILVCCWRSMKEVSLLLGELSQRTPMEDEDREGLVTSLQVKSIGTFFMKLLRKSKHRGAFELAYAGFIKLSTRIWSEPSSIHGLPQRWLSELLQEITSNKSMLCATRRSAGIPFAIQALVGPEPKELGKPCFQNTMATLLNLALQPSENEDQTARVHALNILRALFRDTKLSQEVLPFIGNGVKAAILGFAAKFWAVRNSATMLFSALISRIFGVKRARDELARKNCMTGTEFFSRFPTLHGFLLEQFQQAQEAENTSKPGVTVLHPSLFPSLLLLSRLYPSPNDTNNSNMSMTPFLPYVIRAGCSAVHKTRSIAATALVPLVPPNQLVHTLHHLIDMLLGAANHPPPHPNAIHGILMQIHCLLEKYTKDTNLPHSILDDITSTVLPRFHQLMWLTSRQNKSYITQAAFIAILKDFFVDTTWLHTTSSMTTETTSTSEATVHKTNRSLLLTSILKLAKGEVDDGGLHEMSSSSCPGFPLRQATFASLCFKLRDTILLMEMPGVEQREERIDCYSVYLATDGMQRSLQQPQMCHQQHEQQHQQPESSPSELGFMKGLHLYFLYTPFPEVRMVTLTHLIRVMEQSTCQGSDGILGDTNAHIGVCHKLELIERLMDMMLQEEDHECLAKVCEALSILIPEVLSSRLPSSSSSSSPLGVEPKMFVRQCLDLAHENDAREEILSSVISLSGAVLPLMDYSSQPADNDLSLFQSWANLIKSCSQSGRSAQLRCAVAKLFHHSAVSLLGVVQPHIADIQLSLWDIVVAFLQDDDDDVQKTAARCVMKTARLMPPIKDFAEFTTELEPFLRKINNVLTDVDTCANNEMKVTQPASDWSMLLRLKEGPVSMDILQTMAETYRRVYSFLLSDDVDLVSWDLQPCLLLYVSPYLLSHLHFKENPDGCLATLVNWAREGGIDLEPMSSSEEDSEDPLFEKGEANTNYEEIQLRLASYLQLCQLQTQLK
eukprot:XP_011676163.1 PREDICTED: thyroid adenoma-associated protein homolog isoform X2 [Strongylocentrotus purpuratus]